MPPRIAPTGSSRGSRGRGGPPGRGGGPPSIRGSYSTGASAPASASAAPSASSHITTVGVKRTAYGSTGIQRTVLTNHFAITVPDNTISHYDVITPSEKTLPARLNMELITQLQTNVAPDVFTPKAVYDGRKNLFAIKTLKFPSGTDTQEFDVSLTPVGASTGERGPKIYKIKLNKVAEINPTTLSRFLEGKQSHDNDVLTAITALNVVIRMEPTLKYPYNVRSFFTPQETKDIGLGIVLWRGYFQSARPAIGKMLINIDISTAAMYKSGSLLDLCLEFCSKPGGRPIQPRDLGKGFPERERLRLQRHLSGIRVTTSHTGGSSQSKTPRVVKRLSPKGASELFFNTRDGGQMRVSDYFLKTINKPLQFPDLPCVEVGSGAFLPIELCTVPPGQIMRKQVPSELTKNVLEFATKRPNERLQSIRNGLSVLSYGQSDYVRQFGMFMEPNTGPLKVNARILPAPTLKYANQQAVPKDGAWNMVNKKFYRPATVLAWMVVIFERKQRFNENAADDMISGLLDSFASVGITCGEKNPPVFWENPQSNVIDTIKRCGSQHREMKKVMPTLVIAVLPEGGTDIYTAIKHFGDCITGVATQCLKSNKCSRARPQYYANVCLKINVKLGGINTIPDPASVRYLTDTANPTVVMGADVVHPAPGSEGKPSFTAVVGNVDSDTSKYIATTRVQTSRQEMIEDLEDMARHILSKYMLYRQNFEKKQNYMPKRIIFYRDGVSEGQFQQVLDKELPKIKDACAKLGINPLPKITVLVVGKRHHVRFFPVSPNEGDKSGNCPAGTVVDRDVTNPAEFDFYLQSHGGLLGTSRPSHYNVLLDENAFTPDGLQQLSYALCHVYARSTRAVSIPAPVYYADIVCARAKNHFDPSSDVNLSETYSQIGSKDVDITLESFKKNFRQLAKPAESLMYFS